MNVFDRIIISIYLISTMLFYGFIVGPFSIRIYMAVIILFYIIIKRVKLNLFNVFQVRLYILFIVLFFLNLVINNEIASFNFSKYFLSRFLLCFIMIAVVLSFIKSKKDFQYIVNLLVVIGILNVFVNIFQFFDIGTQFYTLLKNTTDPDSFLDEDSLGLSVGTYGLFGNIVTNGYYSSIFAILFLHQVNFYKKGYKKGFFFILFLLGIFSVFSTQQRSSLLMLFIFILLTYTYRIKNSKKMYITLLIILGAIFLYPFINNLEIGRYEKLTDQNRSTLYSYAIDFVLNHIWFGGITEYSKYMQSKIGIKLAPHNIFLNAFIYAGFFGGISIIILYFSMVIRGFKIFSNNIYNNNTFAITFFGCFIVFMGNSLTHNLSLVTGNDFIWFLFSMVINSNKIRFLKFHRTNFQSLQAANFPKT